MVDIVTLAPVNIYMHQFESTNVDCVGSLVTSCSSPYSLFLIDAMLQSFSAL